MKKSCINTSTQRANKSSTLQLNNNRKITENDVKGNKKDDFLSSKTVLQYFSITDDDIRLLVSVLQTWFDRFFSNNKCLINKNKYIL